MEVCRRSSWLLLLLGVSLLATTLQGVQGEAESEGPSESECRPYIEKALKELETGESGTTPPPETGDSKEDIPTVEITTDDSDHQEGEGDDDTHEGTESIETAEADQNIPDEQQEQEVTQEEASTEGTEPGDAEDADTQEEHEGSQETEAGTSGENDDQNTEEDTGEDTATEGESQEGGDTTETADGEDTQETVEENEAAEAEQAEDTGDTQEETDDTKEEVDDTREEVDDTKEETDDTKEETDDTKEETDDTKEEADNTNEETDDTKEETDDTKEETDDTKEETDDTKEEVDDTKEEVDDTKEEADETKEEADDTKEEADDTKEEADDTREEADNTKEEADDTKEEAESVETEAEGAEQASEEGDTKEESAEGEQAEDAASDQESDKESAEEKPAEGVETEGSPEEGTEDEAKESEQEESREKRDIKSEDTEDDKSDTKEEETAEEGGSSEAEAAGGADERSAEKDDSTPDEAAPEESKEGEAAEEGQGESAETVENEEQESEDAGAEGKESEDEEQTTETEEGSDEGESAPEEELSLDIEIPEDLRDRGHVEHLLKLDEEASETENIINKVSEITLRELKKLYENAIKPLEVLYKYRDLSNRHFGDAEIFSKPLILFMGPWSGGKSSIINYLLDNEYNETSLRTGAEPSPAYFNILMYGEEPEIWDGTQLAADFTFSGLQKFGQGLEERLRGVKLPNKLLEKVNIVEIPGILEVRKQVSRVFPFNDACQWFIDRADIIFLVYDPSKLDVGPETEAILDQLKGREHQTRIILNKADQVKPEELMRVQGALIWNISPLMSSPQPPVMYTTSLWSRPYESWAPTRLLQAQERAFLRDLRSAVDKRIENKIASARRFAVRVRNHAKMVDCYLTTYYNHKSVFGNRKQVADEIIEHPQDYHIYEGLSTLTNISRYDLPDPDVYRDFFKLNPLYDFQQLSATCTYFRGCPINRLDVAIAYDLPELVGKHKRLVESALAEANQTPVPSS